MRQAEWAGMSDRAWATAHAHNWDAATDRFEAALARVAAAGRPRLRTAG